MKSDKRSAFLRKLSNEAWWHLTPTVADQLLSQCFAGCCRWDNCLNFYGFTLGAWRHYSKIARIQKEWRIRLCDYLPKEIKERS